MSIGLFTQIGEAFLEVFGSPAMVGLVIIFFLIFLLLAAKAGKVVVMMVIFPVMITLVGVGISRFIEIPGNYAWLGLAVWMFMGIVFAGVFIFWTQ